jgi:protein-S-isoprenylcysteine O-methyltransferase Ste14
MRPLKARKSGHDAAQDVVAMNPFATPSREGAPRARIPRWMGPVAWAVGFSLVHVLIPWGLSLLAPPFGWTAGRPGLWNWPGVILVVMGGAIVIWAMALHFVRAPEGWAWERTPKYLLRQGPYTFTFLLAWVMFSFAVRREEQALAARFGEAYQAYQYQVPRWLGRLRPKRRAP